MTNTCVDEGYRFLVDDMFSIVFTFTGLEVVLNHNLQPHPPAPPLEFKKKEYQVELKAYMAS